jgi:hypothetical protein
MSNSMFFAGLALCFVGGTLAAEGWRNKSSRILTGIALVIAGLLIGTA